MLLNTLYAFIATLGFGILFNIRGKKLLFASLAGGVCWFFYLLPYEYTKSIVGSYFIASIVLAICSEILARSFKTPVTTFIICGIIPLVPGSGMYYTMLQFIQGKVNESLRTGVETLSIAAAIAVGIALVSTITKLIYRWKYNHEAKK